MKTRINHFDAFVKGIQLRKSQLKFEYEMALYDASSGKDSLVTHSRYQEVLQILRMASSFSEDNIDFAE